jgi:hypothetical protein
MPGPRKQHCIGNENAQKNKGQQNRQTFLYSENWDRYSKDEFPYSEG